MDEVQVWQGDLFLLEKWREDSPLSVNAQREQILSHFQKLGVRGREPYRKRLSTGSRKESLSSSFPCESQRLLERLRLPNERLVGDSPCWVRTCYEPSTEASWSNLLSTHRGMICNAQIYNDKALYDFGSNWENIFLRVPQLLESSTRPEEFEEYIKEALDEAIEDEALDSKHAEENGYDPEEDLNPWPIFYSEYHLALTVGRIYVVDAKAVASEGRDAGKVLVIWYDECGRTIRYYREKVRDAIECANLDDCYLKDYSCWVHAQIGKAYEWGGPLGPPYTDNDEEDST